MGPPGHIHRRQIAIKRIVAVAVVDDHQIPIPGELVRIRDGSFMHDAHWLPFGKRYLDSAARDRGAEPAVRLSSEPAGDDPLGWPGERTAERWKRQHHRRAATG